MILYPGYTYSILLHLLDQHRGQDLLGHLSAIGEGQLLAVEEEEVPGDLVG